MLKIYGYWFDTFLLRKKINCKSKECMKRDFLDGMAVPLISLNL
jgi:hypothetical protein